MRFAIDTRRLPFCRHWTQRHHFMCKTGCFGRNTIVDGTISSLCENFPSKNTGADSRIVYLKKISKLDESYLSQQESICPQEQTRIFHQRLKRTHFSEQIIQVASTADEPMFGMASYCSSIWQKYAIIQIKELRVGIISYESVDHRSSEVRTCI